jgi:hypothetical protein
VPACIRPFKHHFNGRDDVAFLVEGCTGWRYVAEELAAAGVAAHLAEPADTAFALDRKRHAKTDKTGCRHLRQLLAEGVLKPDDGKNIEDVLGADQLGIDPGYQNQVRVTGYPSSADAPITCTGWTAQHRPSQLRFECDGFTGGTSGSPWVTDVDPQTGTGTIVGVIGGYQAGGSTAAISYGPYLGEQVEQLYHQAVADEAAQAASSTPSPGHDPG